MTPLLRKWWYNGKHRTFMCETDNHKKCGRVLKLNRRCGCSCHLPWGAQLWRYVDSWWEGL